ncbi:MAG: hypothetical protein A2W77_05620 [Nitrospinae bacterium RIFCSPLOWO2_12_39_16]|nr:MAG: hypothetical protein A2328_10305 [Bdellovibrionales bacterium RIFOXYB2_FULL_36_6]OGW10680.1 MAG: hypothetical protein A2W77_05620 [Nitrospinae bacterium RIFCSPLOWO2_12_39_16]
MKIEIIPIAERKIKRRGIRKEWIEETISSPVQLVDGYGGRKVAQKMFIIENKKYLLRVVFEKKDEVYIVVTAYFTSQINRYWKEEK